MTVLVLAHERDAPTDRVVRALTARGTPVFRADLRWFPSQLAISAELVDGRWAGVLTTRHSGVELSSIRSVWCRDPGAFDFPAGMTATERAHAFTEARLGIGGVLSSLDALWVNDPDTAPTAAMYKPRQLATAMACGLRVARTLVTNDRLAVHNFARTSDLGLVQKTFGSTVMPNGGRLPIHYTWRTSGYDADRLAGVELTAHQFQDRVDKDHAIRVIVVGDRFFPVAILTRPTAAGFGWWASHESPRYELVTLPTDVQDGLRTYMLAFRLTYAAIDLVVDRGGHHVFLKSNSAGQYSGLEAATGAPITEAIADVLATARTPSSDKVLHITA